MAIFSLTLFYLSFKQKNVIYNATSWKLDNSECLHFRFQSDPQYDDFAIEGEPI